jgi:hypothetical protein
MPPDSGRANVAEDRSLDEVQEMQQGITEGQSALDRMSEREGWRRPRCPGRLGMSRNTVNRLLGCLAPPRYGRSAAGSILDPFKASNLMMLDVEARAPATVIIDRL